MGTSEKGKSNYIFNRIGKMRVIELQANCIMRGLDFTDIVEQDFGRLASWLIKNWDCKKDRELLEDFDIWVDSILEKRGYEVDHPLRKYRKFSNLDEDNNPTVSAKNIKRADIPNKKKAKRERTEDGIFKGTKKEYTYSLAKKLIDKFSDKYTNKELCKKFASQLFSKVEKKFPDSKEKSVRIWMKRALDAHTT